MSEETITDDQSHYEVSLTAGQAFLAFVLLLLSLAASFAFGLMIGRGQENGELLAQATPAIVDEANVAPKKPRERIVELGISEDAMPPAEIRSEPRQPARTAVQPESKVSIREEKAAPPKASPAPAIPHYAQLLSTTDQKKAEALAAKLINGGFMTAYVDRGSNEKGTLFRVRVNFRSLEEARAAESKLKSFSNEVWITKQ